MGRILNYLTFVSLMFLFALPMLAFGQEAVDLSKELPIQDFVMSLVESIGGFKGASSLAIAAAVVQLVMKFFRTSLASFAGKYKLVIVYLLSVVSGVMSMKLAGVDLFAAFLHSNTLAAIQVFGNQVYKQFIVKED